tara:strand:+ start:21178 stop:21777 length:600 start_codon:yes stop_codon:yes gene_type:complete
MFTGIITDVGRIENITHKGDEVHLAIFSKNIKEISNGMSISCAGACLTVASYDRVANGHIFNVYISKETNSKTTLGQYQMGNEINLERSLSFGEEMSGHIVQGHVDCLAKVIGKKVDGESIVFDFEVNENFMKYIASKGSIALDGTSLTVNSVKENRFKVNFIPYTLNHTSWRNKDVGDEVNLEVDVVARYVINSKTYD